MTRSRDLANLADSTEFTSALNTKLTNIETSATADQTDAEIRAAVEAATDSNVFTDADHSKLNAVEASADVTDTANVTAAGALMDSEVANLADVKALNQSLVTTASPTFGGLNFDAASGADAQVVMATDSNSRGFYVDESDTNKMKFYTGYGKGVAGREVTLDNFGSLLVGKTASNSDANGVELLPNGTVYITANNTLPFYINRRGTSGANEMARFSDDGSTKGKIGTNQYGEFNISSEANLTLTQKGGTDKSINFATDHFGPFSGEGGTVDLGRASAQWKDLYLSGGVVFGPASASTVYNETLSTYEKGYFSGRLSSGYSGSVTHFSAVNTGYYTRVGDLVHFEIHLNNAVSGGSASQAVWLTGLPFTVSQFTTVSHWTYGGLSNITAGSVPILRTQSNSTAIVFQKFKDGVGSDLTYQMLGGSINILITGTYHTA